jgi:hypothetical protein
MKKKSNLRLPEKKLKTKVKFEEKIICALNVAMAGKDVETLTDSEKQRFTTEQCVHPMWPPFMPQCGQCLISNKNTPCLVDKKGREYRSLAVTPKKKED